MKESKKYREMSPEQRLDELKKYLRENQDNAKDQILNNLISEPCEPCGAVWEELPLWLGDYKDGELEKEIIKYRIANRIEEVEDDDKFLKQQWFGKIIQRWLEEYGKGLDSEEYEALRYEKFQIEETRNIATIIADEELLEDLACWNLDVL